MDKYYEEKKRRGYILTLHDLNPNDPYLAMDPSTGSVEPVMSPGIYSHWSRLSGRYRTYEEQQEYERSGCIDTKLPPREVDALAV